MWDVTQEVTEAAGFGAYEVSNHAREGAESRHNLIYWRYGDYAGVGPGAHGRLTLGGERWATEGPRAPGAWLAAAEEGCGEVARERLSVEEQRAEFLLMGLRLREGVDWARLKAFGVDDISRNINGLVDMGKVEIVDGRLRATDAGRPVLNAVLRAILA